MFYWSKVLSVTIMKHSKLFKTFNRQKIRKIFMITSSGFHTPRNSKNVFFVLNLPPIENIFLTDIVHTRLYIYNSKRLEFIVVCTSAATSKNSGSGF